MHVHAYIYGIMKFVSLYACYEYQHGACMGVVGGHDLASVTGREFPEYFPN